MATEGLFEHAVDALKRLLPSSSDIAQVTESHVAEMLPTSDLPHLEKTSVVRDALSYAVRQGIARYVTFGKNHAVCITELGRRQLGSVEWLSVEQYVSEASAAAGGKLDPIVEAYLREAKRTSEAVPGLDLSLAVMLGCASERAILQLAEVAAPHLADDKLDEALSADLYSIANVFGKLDRSLREYRTKKKLGRAEHWRDLDVIAQLFHLYRVHRNKAGHPRNGVPDRPALLQFLEGFKVHVSIITGLIEYFGSLSAEAEN